MLLYLFGRVINKRVGTVKEEEFQVMSSTSSQVRLSICRGAANKAIIAGVTVNAGFEEMAAAEKSTSGYHRFYSTYVLAYRNPFCDR